MKHNYVPVQVETDFHIEAFKYWLGDEEESPRTYKKVAEYIGVNENTVGTWAASFDWCSRYEACMKVYRELLDERYTERHAIEELNKLYEEAYERIRNVQDGRGGDVEKICKCIEIMHNIGKPRKRGRPLGSRNKKE